ncbi:MAG: RluA family pseudouridine synthase [Bradymonadaceae bacterium]|nr:RluA family pseudouridine synthase [Lujinxingiaceae bacterium]
MSTKHTFLVRPQAGGERLDQVLVSHLEGRIEPALSRRRARKFIDEGAVFVDGKVVRVASRPVQAGATVLLIAEGYEALAQTEEQPEEQPVGVSLGADDILYEDADIIAVNKPAGLPAQATRDPARDHLVAVVTRFLQARDGVKEPYVGLQHRLDAETSGVMVFARSKRANAGLTEAFRERTTQKTYRALTSGDPKYSPLADEPLTQWMVENHLGRDRNSKVFRQAEVRSGGDWAQTEFRVLEATKTALYVEATPHTGRTHQIRVHLASSDIPILGDTVYGGPRHIGGKAVERTMLHAWRLELPHPVTKEWLVIECPLPEDFEAVRQRLFGV